MAKENKLEMSLIEALSYCGVKELPEEDKKENVWIKSIALVSKKDGSQAYVATVKDKEGNPRIIKDFGSIAAISSIDKHYPYLYLDAKDVPQFKTKEKQERIDWLKIYYPERDFSEAGLKELNRAVINVSIQEVLKRNL